MKFLPLVWKNIWRRKFRTVFTLLSIFIAFVLFGILMTIRYSFAFGVEIAGADRLVLIHKVSLIMPLPVSYQARLQQTKGVEMASHQTWFGGIYQDPSNFFANMAVEPEPFLKIYPEFTLPPEQMQAWRNDRQGAIVGRDLAAAFRLEDRRPRAADRGDLAAERRRHHLGVQHRRHLRRRRYASTRPRCSSATTTSTRTARAARVRSDGTSSRSPIPRRRSISAARSTRCSPTRPRKRRPPPRRDSSKGFAKQIGDIGSIMIAISSTVLFMFGLVAASTMAQSVRERTSELAVLKTLGFSGPMILTLVLAESLFIAFTGGLLGLGLAWLFVQGGDPTNGMLPIFVLPPRDVVLGIGLMALIGILAGLMPAIAAMRLKITDALRRT